MRVEALTLKLVTGRSASSSSLCAGEGGLSGMVEPSETKERCDTLFDGKRACLIGLIGDDCGRLWFFFHVDWRASATRSRLLIAVPEWASFGILEDRNLLLG